MATPEQIALFSRFDPLVRSIAGGIHRSLPQSVDRDDLLAAGRRGLWDAVLRHRADDEASFNGYARIRIQGAVIDELRAQDWLPRSLRESAAVLSLISVEGLAEHWEPRDWHDPLESIELEQTRARVNACVSKLPERERRLIVGHYINERKLQDIAVELGVSQARVSQIHARALNRLRAFMTGEKLPSAKRGKPSGMR